MRRKKDACTGISLSFYICMFFKFLSVFFLFKLRSQTQHRGKHPVGTYQPISCGRLTMAMHHFRPISSCKTPDSIPPVGWHTSNTLPYHDASVTVRVMSSPPPPPPPSVDISDPMTTVGMASDMPKPSIITFCTAIVPICGQREVVITRTDRLAQLRIKSATVAE